MQVRILFFGVLRDGFGGAERSYELAGDSCSVAALLEHVRADAAEGLRGLWPRLAVAINREYARGTDQVRSGDEVALLPPVSGGSTARAQAGDRELIRLTHEVLSVDPDVASLKAGADGAVVTFDGIVRNNTRGRRTLFLFYEAYEQMALVQMRTLAEQARERFGVREVLLQHRLGRLEVGETSVLIAVASAHRGAAFDACRWLIDTLKQTVPIWKKEHFEDGAVWVDGDPFPDSVHPSGAPEPTS